MLGRICIINAPMVFKAIWALVKPLLNPRTLSKIQVRPAQPPNTHGMDYPCKTSLTTILQALQVADVWHSAWHPAVFCCCLLLLVSCTMSAHVAAADRCCRSVAMTTARISCSGSSRTTCPSGWAGAPRARCWTTAGHGVTLRCCGGWRGLLWQPRRSSASAALCQLCQQPQKGSWWWWTMSWQTATTLPGGPGLVVCLPSMAVASEPQCKDQTCPHAQRMQRAWARC